MNEEFLKLIYEKKGFKETGLPFEEFAQDMENEEMQRLVFEKKGFKDTGLSFEEFQKDLQGGVVREKAPEAPEQPTVEESGVRTGKPLRAKDMAGVQQEETKIDLQNVNIPGPTGAPINLGFLKGTIFEDFTEDILRATGRGIEQGAGTTEALTVLAKGAESTGEDLTNLVQQVERQQKYGVSDEFREFTEAKGFRESLKAFAKNPVTITAELITESTMAMARSGGAGIAASALTGPAAVVLTPVSMGMTSAALETSGKMVESMQEYLGEQGLEFNEENIRTIFADEEAWEDIRNKAIAKGAVIGMVDGATAGLVSKMGGSGLVSNLTKTAQKGGKVRPRLTQVATTAKQTGVELASGGVGELAGQAAAGEDVDWKSAALEVIGEVPGAGQSIGSSFIINQKRLGKLTDAEMARAVQDNNQEDFNGAVDVALGLGQINEQQAIELKEAYADIEAVNKTIPDTVSDKEKRKAIIAKIQERKVIENDLETIRAVPVDEALAEDHEAKVKDLEARKEKINNQIKEIRDSPGRGQGEGRALEQLLNRIEEIQNMDSLGTKMVTNLDEVYAMVPDLPMSPGSKREVMDMFSKFTNDLPNTPIEESKQQLEDIKTFIKENTRNAKEARPMREEGVQEEGQQIGVGDMQRQPQQETQIPQEEAVNEAITPVIEQLTSIQNAEVITPETAQTLADVQKTVEELDIPETKKEEISNKIADFSTNFANREPSVNTAQLEEIKTSLKEALPAEPAPVEESTPITPVVDERVFKTPLGDEFAVVPTSNEALGPNIMVDPDTYKKWQELDNEEQQARESIESNPNIEPERKAARLKGVAQEYAARKRRVLGTTTEKERGASASRVKEGDQVTSDGNTYEVTGKPSFGKYPVRNIETGETQRLDRNDPIIQKLITQKQDVTPDVAERIIGEDIQADLADRFPEELYGIRAENKESLSQAVQLAFGLSPEQADASAAVMDGIVANMARRAGITKTEMYNRIEFRKGGRAVTERLQAGGEALFQGPDGEANFERWKGDAELLENEMIASDLKTGVPVVVRAYHGTTHEFYEFDTSVTGNTEGHLGKVNYFTSSITDAEENYLSGGSDITQRVEDRAEQVRSYLFDNYGIDVDEDVELNRELINQLANDFGLTPSEIGRFDTENGPEFSEFPEFVARRELVGGEERVVEVYVKMNNPVKIGYGQQWIDVIPESLYEDSMEDAANEIAEEYDVTPEEALEDYEFEVRERAMELEGIENPLIEALQTAIEDNTYDFGGDISASEILADFSYDQEVELGALEKAIREGVAFTENEAGEYSGSQIVADFFKNLGYDGIVLSDVNQRFPGMNLTPGTSHIHIFDEFSNNIKLADGRNVEFNPDTRDIRFQKTQGAVVANDSNFIIYGLTDPNVSTPLHEISHVYEHYLTDAEREQVLNWTGQDEWNRDTSEKFARGFEKYLAEGKAPNKKLKEIFDQFKKWLLDIYNGITGSDIDLALNDDMRQIYRDMIRDEAELTVGEQLAEVEMEMASMADMLANSLGRAVNAALGGRKGGDYTRTANSIDNNKFVQAIDEIAGDNPKQKAKALFEAVNGSTRLPAVLKTSMEEMLGEPISDFVRRVKELQAQREELNQEMIAERQAAKLQAMLPEGARSAPEIVQAQVRKQGVPDDLNYNEDVGIDDDQLDYDGMIGLKQEDIAEIRSYFELPQDKPSRKRFETVLNDARQYMSSARENYQREAEVVHEILNGSFFKDLDAKQIALRRAIDHLEKDALAVEKDLARLTPGFRNGIEAQTLRTRLDVLRADIHHFTMAYRRLGTTGARLLVNRKQFMVSDFYSEGHLRELMQRAKGVDEKGNLKKLSTTEEYFIKNKSKELKTLQEEIDNLYKDMNLRNQSALISIAKAEVVKMKKNIKKGKHTAKMSVQDAIAKLRNNRKNGPC